MTVPMKMIYVNTTTGCWVWQGKPTKTGYGQIYRNGKNYKAHRYVYEQVNGAMIGDYDLHHICENRLCVNPMHLEPMTKPMHATMTRTTKICPLCNLPIFICEAKKDATGGVCV